MKSINKFCSVCGLIFKDHSNTKLKSCELITRILKQEQQDLTQIKMQALISAVTMLLPSIVKSFKVKK